MNIQHPTSNIQRRLGRVWFLALLLSTLNSQLSTALGQPVPPTTAFTRYLLLATNGPDAVARLGTNFNMGTVYATQFVGGTFSGNGSGLTNLPGSGPSFLTTNTAAGGVKLTNATPADLAIAGRMTATQFVGGLFTGNGSGLTNLNLPANLVTNTFFVTNTAHVGGGVKLTNAPMSLTISNTTLEQDAFGFFNIGNHFSISPDGDVYQGTNTLQNLLSANGGFVLGDGNVLLGFNAIDGNWVLEVNSLLAAFEGGPQFYVKNGSVALALQGTTNALADWPTEAGTPGGYSIVNSNGTVYVLTSLPQNTAWAMTNKIAPSTVVTNTVITAGVSRTGIGGRRVMMYQYIDTTAASDVTWLGARWSVTGNSESIDTTTTRHGHLLLTTNTNAANVGQTVFASAGGYLRPDKQASFEWRVQLTNTVTERCWMGFSDAAMNAFYFDTQLPSGRHTAAFRFSTNSPNWFLVTQDGSGGTQTDSGVAADTNYHAMSLTLNVSNVVGYVDGVAIVTNAANLPGATLLASVQVTTLTNQHRGFRLFGVYGEQEF